MRVRLADLNLSTADGAKIAFSRIGASAQAFCGVGIGRQPLDRVAAESRCVAEMTRRGVDSLHAPLVTALLLGGASSADQASEMASATVK